MYVELHASSAFSFLQATSQPEELVQMAAKMDMAAIGLIDRDGLFGAPRFHLEAQNLGIRPHLGAEITAIANHHYPLLVETRQGYQNLCRLITNMKMRAPKGEGIATIKELAAYARGLICLTGDDSGPLAAALRNGGISSARQCLHELIDIFGRQNVYVEIQRHLNREEEKRIQAIVSLAREIHLPLLATNGVRHTTERETLDVFTCIRNHRTLETAGRLLAQNDERRIKSQKEMAHLFRDIPEAIAHTEDVSSRLNFTLDDIGYEFPHYSVPSGETMGSFLQKKTYEGARKRYRPFHQKARLQIEHELSVIDHLGLNGYFLIVWDIVEFCRKESILIQGRGSAANSAVCYSLGITAIDPVGMNLLFERFLSKERGKWPDIDLDLPSGADRERAIQYVYTRYGKYGAAMTANVITYRNRSAAREVGRVLGFNSKTLHQLSDIISEHDYDDPNESIKDKLLNIGLNFNHLRIQKFIQLCNEIQHLPRHIGQHSGGMVISGGALNSIVPLEPATMPGRSILQWNKDDCASLGMVKIDLLGLGMLSVLRDSIKLIGKAYGQAIDLANLPHDDPLVYKTLQKADTIGMFQIESRAQMACLPRLKPSCFYDLVIEVAIIRPGPIVGDMVNPYLKRRQGLESITYFHPSLEPILKRTLGIPLFQEQLLRIAMTAGGFTGDEAEQLRRAFTSRDSKKKLLDITIRLKQGMSKNGISTKAQDQILQAIKSFSMYGFPESHAASFALIAYASAYLKCHYLPAFTAALLNNQPMGFYKPATLIKDAQRHGLLIQPIHVGRSYWLCTLENSKKEGTHSKKPSHQIVVRLGLHYIKGLRKITGIAIVKERAKRPFQSIEDLVCRVPGLQKKELKLLAEIGALNSINSGQALTRRDALWEIERASRRSGPLLDPIIRSALPSPLKKMTYKDRIFADFRVSGITVGKHLMALYREKLTETNILRTTDLYSLLDGTWIQTAGILISRQRPGTANGFVFISLEDETGITNGIITPEIFKKNKDVIMKERFILIAGYLQRKDNTILVKVSTIQALSL